MSQPTPENRALHLTKHHGAGNDFLVLADMGDATPLEAEVVRALCDRRFGLGADGAIRVHPAGGEADLAMELRNADGSVAEMSGNGIRCLAQAAVELGLVTPPSFTVLTLGGVRTIEYLPGEQPGSAVASVDMGQVVLGPDQPQQFADRRARRVDLGNPHLVLLGPDPADLDIAGLGGQLQDVHPGGINVEFISVASDTGSITLRVWERGAGETLACGTGSVAAVAAAHSWGLVGATVDVHNPGGMLQVALDGGAARLKGPVRKVAEIDVDRQEILAAARR